MKFIKIFILQILLLFVIPIAFAEISINLQEKKFYNLGDKILPVVSIKEDQELDGFFKLKIICDDFDLQYYTSPLSLEADVRTQITVPELTLFESMQGNCRIKAGFDEHDGTKVNTASSNEFIVSKALNIITEEDLEAKPGEDFIITANIKKQNNESISKGDAEISFRNKVYETQIVSGRLEYIINLGYDVEAGDFSISIVVTDKPGNYGKKILNLKVLQIPTRIENQIENDILLPGDSLKTKIVLYDHIASIIKGNIIKIAVFDPEDNPITETEIESASTFGFDIDNSFVPGVYLLSSVFEDIRKQSTFTIVEIRKIVMRQEGSSVHIENTGNVDYDDEVTIILEGDGKNYLINKKIELKPQETFTIDLSEEVPQGTYDIILPEDAVEDEINVGEADESENTQDVFGPVNIIKGVQIDDNRNAIKKTGDGLAAVSGAVISTAQIIASKPTLASIILVSIILGVITYYSRGFIIQKIRKKKPEDTSHLFEDFKYEDKK